MKHEGGYITAYAHLDVLSVKEGDVGDGTVIGQVGTTGYVDSLQLHLKFAKAELQSTAISSLNL